jgi:hypothetical protein
MGASWVPLGCLLGVSWVLLGAPGCSWLLLAAVGFPGPLPRMPSPPSPPPIRSNPSSIHASGHQARGGARAWLPLPPSGFSELLADVFVARAFVSVGSSSQSWRKPLCFLFATTTICFCCWRISWWRPIRRMESCWLYIIIACAGLMRVLGSAKGGWRHGSKLLDPPAVGFCRARILFLRARMDSA